MNRHKSTIGRELRCNRGLRGYRPKHARRASSYLSPHSCSQLLNIVTSRRMRCDDAYAVGETTTLWSVMARDLGLHIVGGFAERTGSTLYNSAAVISPAGRIGLFRKVHLWGDENLFFSPGDLGFPVFSTEHGTLGVGICYDGWFPEFYRSCALKGAELVCVPTNWCQLMGKIQRMGKIQSARLSHQYRQSKEQGIPCRNAKEIRKRPQDTKRFVSTAV